MKTRSDSLVRMLAAAVLVCAAALAFTPVSARTPLSSALSDSPSPAAPAAAGWQADPEPEDLAVAEFGIDPVVTGPVSAAFRERQARLGCRAATWPDIPAGCYPSFD